MKLGPQLNSFDWSEGPERIGRDLADIGRAAEEAGFDRIGVADHLWQHPIMGGPEANEPECYTTLAFLAANTEPDRAHGHGVGGTLPPPRRTRQVGDNAGRSLRRTRPLRCRLRPLRRRDSWARHPLSPAKRALRDAGRDAPGRPEDVERREWATSVPSKENTTSLHRPLNLPQSLEQASPARS